MIMSAILVVYAPYVFVMLLHCNVNFMCMIN